MKQSIGDKVVSRLQGFAATLKNGEPLEGRFNCRLVELELDPKPYGPKQVKELRKLLGVSQALFAKFLGVTVKTVQSWEQKQVLPSGMACRFMDEINHNPEWWKARLRESVVVKTPAKAKIRN